MAERTADLLVVGGGINGTAIARDAAGRGASVILCEEGDLARATSSASSKLIHGGLRYLEYYEFRLVREALFERERLLAAAPHIIWPLRFVLPHDPALRPAWMVRLGLWLYDHLAPRRRLPGTQSLRLARDPAGAPLEPTFARAFAYSDCWVEDARLVVLNAVDAARHGAEILTRTRCVSARRTNGLWHCVLTHADGTRREVEARILVNAAGPWVMNVLTQTAGLNSSKKVRLIKGSHIVVPRLYDGDWAYILQSPDGRVVFVIPYEGSFTLIGTTDVPFEDDASHVAITTDETDYLCAAVNRYFKTKVAPADVIWSYAGVRPLFDDAAANASAVTRDYVLDVDAPPGDAPVLSVFGGKITTARMLAEHALEKLAPWLPEAGPAWTQAAALPGGDMPDGDFERFVAALSRRKAFLPPGLAHRLARAYGTCVDTLLGDATSLADLGTDFGGDLTQREVEYLVRHEWAQTAEDILWRRSKLGLHLPASAAVALTAALVEISRQTQGAARAGG